jgi:hypothetical protein
VPSATDRRPPPSHTTFLQPQGNPLSGATFSPARKEENSARPEMEGSAHSSLVAHGADFFLAATARLSHSLDRLGNPETLRASKVPVLLGPLCSWGPPHRPAGFKTVAAVSPPRTAVIPPRRRGGTMQRRWNHHGARQKPPAALMSASATVKNLTRSGLAFGKTRDGVKGWPWTGVSLETATWTARNRRPQRTTSAPAAAYIQTRLDVV